MENLTFLMIYEPTKKTEETENGKERKPDYDPRYFPSSQRWTSRKVLS